MARRPKEGYSTEIEQMMLLHYNSLAEKESRHYAAIEAKKLGTGGITYISNLFKITRHKVRKGIKELENPALFAEIPPTKQRRKGAGAPKKKTILKT